MAKKNTAKTASKKTAKPSARKASAPKSSAKKTAKKAVKAAAPKAKPGMKKPAAKPAVKSAAKKATGKITAAAATKPATAKLPAAPKAAAASPGTKGKKGKAAAFPALSIPEAAKVPRVEKSKGSEPINLHHVKPSPAQLKEFRKALVDRRRQLAGDVRAMEKEAFEESTREISANHLADSSSDVYGQDFTLHMIENETTELRAIERAMAKIDRGDSGEYGRCESCGIWISTERLRAKPYAQICIHCIGKFEREGGGEAYGIVHGSQKL